jgi:hypothetical protein
MRLNPILARIKAGLASRDPKVRAKILAQNEALLRCKAVIGQLHNDATLTNLSIAYKNEEYIGTKLMPVVSVPKLSDAWITYSKRDRLSGPDDNLGNRSNANEINENRGSDTYSCKGYGLKNFISETDLQNQDAPLDEMVDLTASVNDVLDLKEEIRIATVMTTAANFGSNTAALTGGDRWDTATSDPVGDIEAAIDSLWGGFGATRTIAYSGPEVMRALTSHPAILDRFKNVTGGSVTRLQVLSLFPEIDEWVVGRARRDTANEGQTAAYSRVWGKQFGIVKVAATPSRRIAAFGFTLRFQGQRTTTEWYDPTVGTRGGYYVRVAMEEDHKITAADTGYLYTTVVS